MIDIREIKEAIEELSPALRSKLEALAAQEDITPVEFIQRRLEGGFGLIKPKRNVAKG